MDNAKRQELHEAGRMARREGLTVIDNPYFEVSMSARRLGVSQEEHQAHIDAWDAGWREENENYADSDELVAAMLAARPGS